jgi:hypothetical protein
MSVAVAFEVPEDPAAQRAAALHHTRPAGHSYRL